jgi:hypothetical protein
VQEFEEEYEYEYEKIGARQSPETRTSIMSGNTTT